ncbi:MAG: alkaline phosphatase, partial [Verrucomicrobiota bacterium]|nr:alkaline phosphatase [Verrucomicrobiota bacterium]
MGSIGLAGTSILLHREVTAALSKLKSPIKLGLIADLHQDVMHDGPTRLKAFLDAMTVEKPDALLQLGDFAYPSKKNTVVTEA